MHFLCLLTTENSGIGMSPGNMILRDSISFANVDIHWVFIPQRTKQILAPVTTMIAEMGNGVTVKTLKKSENKKHQTHVKNKNKS